MENAHMQDELKKSLSKNSALHLIIENETLETPHGQITINVNLVNGVADLTTLNIVKNKRIKYHQD